MTTLCASERGTSPPLTDYQRQVIAANRAMAERGIVRIDYRHDPKGLERFRRALEQRG